MITFLFFISLFLQFALFCSVGFVPPTKPDYSDLNNRDSSVLSDDPLFIKACEEYAGYYKDSTKNPSLNKTILIAGVNNGYKDFFHNFKCYTDRLGLKFFPLSLDEGIYTYLTSNKIATTYLMSDIPGRGKVASEPSRFGGKNFNLIGCRKMEAVHAALKLGYDVIFSDVDIALLADPVEYLFFPGIDYTHSSNNGCDKKWFFNDTMEGNTGFYAVKSNPQTIRTWDLTYKLCAKSPLYDDQTILWLILRTNQNPSPVPIAQCPKPKSYYDLNPKAQNPNLVDLTIQRTNDQIVTCPLNNCMFSSGNIRENMYYEMLGKSLKRTGNTAVAVHANWMTGKDQKKAALARSGLWIARRRGGVARSAAANNEKVRPIAGNWTCVEPTSFLVSKK